jgi:Tfp pilus assembly pilus retraction ATPase PilT
MMHKALYNSIFYNSSKFEQKLKTKFWIRKNSKVYRVISLKDLIKVLKALGEESKIKRLTLLTGPTGSGKTTFLT